jgi:hypothetical protein
MKFDNPLVRGLYSGLMGGAVGGLIFTSQKIIEYLFGLPTEFPDILTLNILMIFLGYAVPSNAIWGGIFGTVYSRFYHRVPSKGVKKGFVWGCIIFLISNLWIASRHFVTWFFAGFEPNLMWSYQWATSFSIWLPYGIILGILYERWK